MIAMRQLYIQNSNSVLILLTYICSFHLMSLAFFNRFVIVFLCCTVISLSQVRGGLATWDLANMFNPATFCMYVPVPSQEPVI